MSIPDAEYIPFLLQGAGSSHDEAERNLAFFFDGPIPEVGDVVELVCYERTPGNVMMTWRVKKKERPDRQPDHAHLP